MNHGNWVPIDKRLRSFLPLNREYSKVEAAFSLQLDYDSGNNVSASGYAKLWGWSRNKVSKFLKDMDVEISSLKTCPMGGYLSINQKGQARDKPGTSQGQAKLKHNNKLEVEKDKLGTSQGQAKDTTIDTNTKTDIKHPKENGFILPGWIDENIWQEYMSVRVRLKAVNSSRAKKALVVKLEDFRKHHDPNRLIEAAIENSWKSIYIPKNSQPVGGLVV